MAETVKAPDAPIESLTDARDEWKDLQSKSREFLAAAALPSGDGWDLSRLSTFNGNEKAAANWIDQASLRSKALVAYITQQDKLQRMADDLTGQEAALTAPRPPAPVRAEQPVAHMTPPELLAPVLAQAPWRQPGYVPGTDPLRGQSHAAFSAELPDTHMAALFQRSSYADAPELHRLGVIDEARIGTLNVLDVIGTITPVSQAVIHDQREAVTAAKVAEAAEGGASLESTIAYTAIEYTVRTIRTMLPISEESLADIPRIESYMGGRLIRGVQQRLNNQILVGNGTAPNLQGINGLTGIGTGDDHTNAALGSPTNAEVQTLVNAIFSSMGRVEDGEAQPSAIIMEPKYYRFIRGLRATDGSYLFGNPAVAGAASIDGVPIVRSSGQAANTITVGDFANYAELFYRNDFEFEVGLNDADFSKFQRTIRANVRAAVGFRRPQAFAKIVITQA